MCSNRTFMELKLRYFSFMCLLCTSSNRTFMELKFETDVEVEREAASSNRTFMELKYFNESGGVFGEEF